MSKTARTLAAAGFILASALPAFAQQADAPSKEKVQELIARATQQIAPAAPSPIVPILQTGPTVNLTEKEAVARATEKNLTLISERITPQTWDYAMAASKAAYAYTLTSSIANNNAVTPTSSIFEGGASTTTQQQSWSGGFSKRMWWGGGNYNLSWSNNRNETNQTSSTCNPCFTSGLVGTFTQPLWQNFRIDQTRASIMTNEISQQIADLNLGAQEVSILSQVRNAYWELSYARYTVEAAQRSLELATKLVGDNRARVEIGTLAPIDVVQAQAEEANRKQQLVTAQATLRNSELALKRLIVSGTDDELWRAVIVPIDQPTVTAQPIDLEAAVANALSRRIDLTTTKKNLETTDIQLRVLENQTKPQLDVIGSLNLAGRAGVSRPLRDPITGEDIIVPPGGYLDALRSVGAFDAPTWNVRLQFAYPLGTSAQEANLSRQQLLKQQTEANLKATELTVATEVTSAALAIRNSFEAMETTKVSRELSQQRLEAAQAKFDQGMATNYEVVQAQRDLVDARNLELRRLLDYQRALVDFQRVQIIR